METANFRLLVANRNGKRRFVFLGRQTINCNRQLLVSYLDSLAEVFSSLTPAQLDQRFLGLTWTAGRKHFQVPPEELDANIFRFTWTAGRKYFQLHSCALGCSDFHNLGLFTTG
jgi:hypothetical protein